MHQIRQNARPTSVRRAARLTIAIAPLVDPRACSSDDRVARRSTSDAIVRRARSSIDERRARSLIAIVDRAARSTIAIMHRAACRRGALVDVMRRDLGSLSLIWALSSLSLSLSLFSEVIWSENEGRKWFPGQRWKYWSTGSHFPENDIFRDSQTCGKGWKWFPEIIVTQNKRTLKVWEDYLN